MDLTLWALGAWCRVPPVQHIGDWPNSLDCTDLKSVWSPPWRSIVSPLLHTYIQLETWQTWNMRPQICQDKKISSCSGWKNELQQYEMAYGYFPYYVKKYSEWHRALSWKIRSMTKAYFPPFCYNFLLLRRKILRMKKDNGPVIVRVKDQIVGHLVVI